MKTLRKGDKGRHVRYLQSLLNKHGFHVTADGDFGNKTDGAVRTFQAQAALTGDGIVGDRTWAALRVTRVEPVPKRIVAEGQVELRQLVQANTRKGTVERKALLTAVSYLGASEDPPGSNRGPEIDPLVLGYMEHWQWPPENRGKFPAWCAIFCSSSIRLGLGIDRWEDTPMGNWFGGVAQWEQWARDAGRTTNARPGAVFTMGRNGSDSDAIEPGRVHAGHCGFVIACDDKTITTIEGNVSDAVVTRVRNISDLRFFVRWW